MKNDLHFLIAEMLEKRGKFLSELSKLDWLDIQFAIAHYAEKVQRFNDKRYIPL